MRIFHRSTFQNSSGPVPTWRIWKLELSEYFIWQQSIATSIWTVPCLSPRFVAMGDEYDIINCEHAAVLASHNWLYIAARSMSLITGWAVSNVAFNQTILKEYSNCKLAAVTFFLFVITLPVSSCLPCTQRVYVCHAPLQEVGSFRVLVLCNRCDHWSGPVGFHHCSICALSGTYCVYCSEKEGGNSVNGLVAHFFPWFHCQLWYISPPPNHLQGRRKQ